MREENNRMLQRRMLMREGSDKWLKISLLMTQVRGSWGWVVRWLIHSLCKLVPDSGKVNQTDQRCWENSPGTSVTASDVLISFWLFPPLCLSSSELCLFNSDLVSRKVPKKKTGLISDITKKVSPFELLSNNKKCRKNAYLFLEIGCGGSLEFAQNTQG